MRSPAARALLCSAAALAVVVGWQAATVYANYGGDWSALFYTGDFMRLPADVAAEQPYRFPASPGYDGAFYHMLAHAPSMPADTRASIDNPPLRWRRILVPFLAFAVAVGDQERIDSAYIAVIDVFVALGTAALALFLVREGIRAEWGVLFPLVPAALVSLDRMPVDAALAALVVVFSVAEGPVLWMAAALAPLVRETGWVLIAAYAVMRWRRPWLPVSAAVPAAVWFAWVRLKSHPDATAWLSAIPFRGLIARTLDVFPVLPHTRWERIALSLDYLAVFGIWAALAVVLWMASNRDGSRLAVTAYLFAVVAASVSKADVWQDAYAFARTQSPLLICCALWGLAKRRWIALAPVGLTLPRLLFQLEPQLKGILHRVI
jgi:hypothetical protein